MIRICDELLEPLLERVEPIAADGSLTPDDQRPGTRARGVEHVEGHLDHMVVFQQERRVIEAEEQWRRVRRSRKRFERLLDGVLARCEEAGLLRGADRSLALRACSGWSTHAPVVPPGRASRHGRDHQELLRPGAQVVTAIRRAARAGSIYG